MPQKPKSVGAMFDIRPVNQSGRVDLARIQVTNKKINLRGQVAIKKPELVRVEPSTQDLVPETISREAAIRELEQTINSERDAIATITSFNSPSPGSVQHRPITNFQPRLIKPRMAPRLRPIIKKVPGEDKQFKQILSEIGQPFKRWDNGVEATQEPGVITIASPAVQARPDDEVGIYNKKVVGAIVGVAMMMGASGTSWKDAIERQGSLGAERLVQAKESLRNFDFKGASEDFIQAGQAFADAQKDLNPLGEGISNAVGSLPGAGKIKAANNLLATGKILADTGHMMTDVVAAMSQQVSVLSPLNDSKTFLSQVIRPLQNIFGQADKNLKQVNELVADIDPDVLPGDLGDKFLEFRDQLPEYQELVNRGSAYTSFFQEISGNPEEKKYLMLFQNSTELRPTGGFPGTYGVLTLEAGKIKDFFVRDVYDLDGQIQELIVPPAPLAHITYGWAMRDANWFVDFPASARKVMEFYQKESNQKVDGVIAIDPKVLGWILEAIGPIDMPAYDMVVEGGNFLANIQAEVEYGDGKKVNRPKQIVTDLAPLILGRLMNADKSVLFPVFNSLMRGLAEKNILAYFDDYALERVALKEDFGGQVVNTSGDYLMVAIANVKGAKTDAVTDTSMALKTHMEGSDLVHKLTLTRRNNGSSAYGFYNQQNSAYVRVLVPNGSQLVKISGNAKPNFKPLINYEIESYAYDADLMALTQNSVTDPVTGAVIGQESGKTVFGFWMLVDPHQTRTVELEYRLPSEVSVSDYRLYVQKQPGLEIKNFSFELNLPAGLAVAKAQPGLRSSGNKYVFNTPLKKDLPVQLLIK